MTRDVRPYLTADAGASLRAETTTADRGEEYSRDWADPGGAGIGIAMTASHDGGPEGVLDGCCRESNGRTRARRAPVPSVTGELDR